MKTESKWGGGALPRKQKIVAITLLIAMLFGLIAMRDASYAAAKKASKWKITSVSANGKYFYYDGKNHGPWSITVKASNGSKTRTLSSSEYKITGTKKAKEVGKYSVFVQPTDKLIKNGTFAASGTRVYWEIAKDIFTSRNWCSVRYTDRGHKNVEINCKIPGNKKFDFVLFEGNKVAYKTTVRGGKRSYSKRINLGKGKGQIYEVMVSTSCKEVKGKNGSYTYGDTAYFKFKH